MKRLLLLILLLQLPALAWWDASWNYRLKVNISSAQFSNFTANFTMDTASLIAAGRMNADCSDLRMTWLNRTSGNEHALDYWISRDCGRADTLIFTKLLEAGSNESIYCYYGNSGASSASDASPVFSSPSSFLPFEGDAPVDVVGGHPASYDNISVGDTPFSLGGILGNATWFDDADDAVNLSYLMADGLDNFTVAFWVNSTKTGNFTIVSVANSSQPDELTIMGNSTFLLVYVLGSSGSVDTGNLNDGSWHHVAVTRNATNISIYADGAYLGFFSAPSPVPLSVDSNGLWMGQHQGAVGGSWISGDELLGAVDEFLIYNRTLAPNEIARLASFAQQYNVHNQTKLLLNASSGSSVDTSVNLRVFQGSTTVASGQGTLLDGFLEGIYNLSAGKSLSGGDISIRIDNFDFSDHQDVLFQFDDSYSGPLTWDVDSITPICAATVPGQWDRAFLTIPKQSHTIDKILHCSSWDFAQKACSGWSSADTSSYSGFGQNTTHFWFYATQFDAYGGGNLSLPDLHVGKITFNVSSFREDEFINISANVSNLGGQSASSVKVWLNITDCNSVELPMQEKTVDLAGGQWKFVNFVENFSICTFALNIAVDPTDAVSESNEFNNFNSTNITIPSWGYYYGNVSSEVVLANEDVKNVSLWTPSAASGNVFVADYDASINFSALWPLNGTNDFKEADEALKGENFTDGISDLYDSDDNDIADETATFQIFSYSLLDVPVHESYSGSPWKTGILWDRSDGGAEYNGSQDLVFIVSMEDNQNGAFGVSDYEMRVPAHLRNLAGSDPRIVMYYEIK